MLGDLAHDWREVMGKLTDEQIEQAARNAYAAWKPFVQWDDSATKKYWREAMRASAPHLQYQPEPVSGDLLERFCNSYDSLIGHTAKKRVEAVIRVVLDEALKPVTDQEREEMAARNGLWANELLSLRRARLLRPKSPEERVTVEVSFAVSGTWRVKTDDAYERPYFHWEEDAELFRQARIAKLKEEESHAD